MISPLVIAHLLHEILQHACIERNGLLSSVRHSTPDSSGHSPCDLEAGHKMPREHGVDGGFDTRVAANATWCYVGERPFYISI